MTEITGTVIRHEDIEAALARLRAYSDKIKTVMADAERGSMAAAADLALVYEAREWVKDLPPIKVAHRRGQPVKADSITRFAEWINEHPEAVGDVWSRAHINGLLSSHQIASEYLVDSTIYSEQAIRPLRRFMKDRQAELPDIARRIRQITDGGPVVANAVKLAIHDHQQSLAPARVPHSGPKTTTDHAAIIRAEFRAILNAKRFRDAGALLNELRAELMTAAGIDEPSR